MNKKEHFNKIYFNCRRGILELDIILINFLETKYFNLNKYDLQQFIDLLKEEDIDLYYWLVKGKVCKNQIFKKIILMIKNQTNNFDFY
jgi:antitoxin CptB